MQVPLYRVLFTCYLKVDIGKPPEDLKMELISLVTDTNLNQKFSQAIARLLFLHAKQKLPLFTSLG